MARRRRFGASTSCSSFLPRVHLDMLMLNCSMMILILACFFSYGFGLGFTLREFHGCGRYNGCSGSDQKGFRANGPVVVLIELVPGPLVMGHGPHGTRQGPRP